MITHPPSHPSSWPKLTRLQLVKIARAVYFFLNLSTVDIQSTVHSLYSLRRYLRYAQIPYVVIYISLLYLWLRYLLFL